MTNNEILERTGLPSMEDLLIRKNLRWNFMRMSPDRLPMQVYKKESPVEFHEDVTRQATNAGL